MHDFYKFYYTIEAKEITESWLSKKIGPFAVASAAALGMGNAAHAQTQDPNAALKRQAEEQRKKPIPLDPKVTKHDGQNVNIIVKSTDKANKWIVCYQASQEPVVINGKPYAITVRWRDGETISVHPGGFTKILGTIQTDGGNRWWVNDTRIDDTWVPARDVFDPPRKQAPPPVQIPSDE